MALRISISDDKFPAGGKTYIENYPAIDEVRSGIELAVRHWMLRVTKGLDVRQDDQSIYASQDDPSCENSVTVGEDNSDCDRADVQLEADESSAASSIE